MRPQRFAVGSRLTRYPLERKSCSNTRMSPYSGPHLPRCFRFAVARITNPIVSQSVSQLSHYVPLRPTTCHYVPLRPTASHYVPSLDTSVSGVGDPVSWMHHCLKNGPLQVTSHACSTTTNLVPLPLAPEGATFGKVKYQRNVICQHQKLTNMKIDITTVPQFFQPPSCNNRDLIPAETVSDSAAPLLP